MREGQWVIADLRGKGGLVRTVAVPIWVKQGIDIWRTAAEIEDGRLLRSISKSGKLNGDALSDWAAGPWSSNPQRKSESSALVLTIFAGPVRSSAARPEAISSRSSFCSGTPRSRRQNATSVRSRKSPFADLRVSWIEVGWSSELGFSSAPTDTANRSSLPHVDSMSWFRGRALPGFGEGTLLSKKDVPLGGSLSLRGNGP
jgi:hypothetical protein